MKTMTCKDLGGPCDTAFSANSADEVIKAQDAHLKERLAAGDDAHGEAAAAMKGRWKRPISGMKWYSATKKAFAGLPDDK